MMTCKICVLRLQPSLWQQHGTSYGRDACDSVFIILHVSSTIHSFCWLILGMLVTGWKLACMHAHPKATEATFALKRQEDKENEASSQQQTDQHTLLEATHVFNTRVQYPKVRVSMLHIS